MEKNKKIFIHTGLNDSQLRRKLNWLKFKSFFKTLFNKEPYKIKENNNMQYIEYIKYLNKKYGHVPFDYFCNETCRSKNSKNKRSDECLYVHHCNEDKNIRLSDTKVALALPFDNQMKENLVYCNLYEHFLLHQKIILEGYLPNQHGIDKLEGVIEYMIPKLCNHFSGRTYNQKFNIDEQRIVQPYRNEFIKEVAKLYVYITTSNNANAIEMRERYKRMNYSLSFPQFITQEKPYIKEARLKTPDAAWLKEKPTAEQIKNLNILLDEIQKEINSIK